MWHGSLHRRLAPGVEMEDTVYLTTPAGTMAERHCLVTMVETQEVTRAAVSEALAMVRGAAASSVYLMDEDC